MTVILLVDRSQLLRSMFVPHGARKVLRRGGRAGYRTQLRAMGGAQRSGPVAMVVTERVGWSRADICGIHSSLVARCHLAACRADEKHNQLNNPF